MMKRYSLAALLFVIAGPAHAEPIVLDQGGMSFFFLVTVITGTIAWWRHTRGDRLPAVAVWSALLITAFMVTRYGPDDTLTFFARIIGA